MHQKHRTNKNRPDIGGHFASSMGRASIAADSKRNLAARDSAGLAAEIQLLVQTRGPSPPATGTCFLDFHCHVAACTHRTVPLPLMRKSGLRVRNGLPAIGTLISFNHPVFGPYLFSGKQKLPRKRARAGGDWDKFRIADHSGAIPPTLQKRISLIRVSARDPRRTALARGSAPAQLAKWSGTKLSGPRSANSAPASQVTLGPRRI